MAGTRRTTTCQRLVGYYLDCVIREAAPEARHEDSQVGSHLVPIVAATVLDTAGTLELTRPQSSPLLDALAGAGRDIGVFYGYPILAERRASGGGHGYDLLPILLQELEGRLLGDRLTLTAADGPVQVNGAFLTELFGSDVEARSDLLEALGLFEPEPPDIGQVAARIPEALGAMPGACDIDPCDVDPHLPSLDDGLHNVACVCVGRAPSYTNGLEAELRLLREHLAGGGAPGGALRTLFTLGSEDAPSDRREAGQVIDVLPTTDGQRAAVAAALSRPLTVITGPPGTGKSQVVATIVANAGLRGETVLLSSRNHKAVDVVEARVNHLTDVPMLNRAGNRSGDRQLRAELLEHLTWVTGGGGHPGGDARAAIAASLDLQQQRERLEQQAAELGDARAGVDRADRELRAHPDHDGDGPLRIIPAGHRMPTVADDLDAVAARIVAHAAPGGWLRRTARRVRRPFDLRRARRVACAIADEPWLRGRPPPTDEGEPDAWARWLGLATRARDLARLVLGHRAAVERLTRLPTAADLAARLYGLQAEIRDAGLGAIRAHARSLPRRLTPDQRATVAHYQALLRRLLAGKDGAAYHRSVQLFPELLPVLPTWCVTNLSARATLPLRADLFDLLVLDEASQCDIASAVPLLHRARRVVVLGDPQQLRHIATLASRDDDRLRERHGVEGIGHERFGFVDNSLYDVAAGSPAIERPLMLTDHFRSHRDIIGFCNGHFYGGQLEVMTDHRRLVAVEGPRLRWIDVSGRTERPHGRSLRNRAEAEAVIDHVIGLLDDGSEGTVGIITPFRPQADLLADLVRRRVPPDARRAAHLVASTVHAFQGDERDLIVFSPTISTGSAAGPIRFLRRNGNLFNVAVSRACSAVHVVGDRRACAGSGIRYLSAFIDEAASLASAGGEERPDATDESTWSLQLRERLRAYGYELVPRFEAGPHRVGLAWVGGPHQVAVEVDGEEPRGDGDACSVHRDIRRDQVLISRGWRVLRFWVHQLREDPDGVAQRIIDEIERTPLRAR